MNENERGITPPDVTAMTVEPYGRGWRVTIEQGNGDVIKTVELTSMERVRLAGLLYGGAHTARTSVSFVDVTR